MASQWKTNEAGRTCLETQSSVSGGRPLNSTSRPSGFRMTSSRNTSHLRGAARKFVGDLRMQRAWHRRPPRLLCQCPALLAGHGAGRRRPRAVCQAGAAPTRGKALAACRMPSVACWHLGRVGSRMVCASCACHRRDMAGTASRTGGIVPPSVGAPLDDLGDVGVDVLEGLPDDALRDAAHPRDADVDVPLQRLAAYRRRHLLNGQHALDAGLRAAARCTVSSSCGGGVFVKTQDHSRDQASHDAAIGGCQ